jgi:hypothetical protein
MAGAGTRPELGWPDADTNQHVTQVLRSDLLGCTEHFGRRPPVMRGHHLALQIGPATVGD